MSQTPATKARNHSARAEIHTCFAVRCGFSHPRLPSVKLDSGPLGSWNRCVKSMGSRLYNTVVVLFWVATMSWLLVSKVLPPLRVGDPPAYPSVASNDPNPDPVCWIIRSNDAVIGWAASRIEKRPENMVELQSYVYLNELPLDHMAPGWLGAFVKPALRHTGQLSMVA